MQNINIVRHIYITKILLEKGANDLIYKDFNLTESSFIPMKMISEGVNTILEMKKFSTESSASLTQKMNNLEKLNLVRRHLDKKDKRKWNFSLTKKGHSILKKIIAKKEKALSLLFKDFSAKELHTFNKLLEKIEVALLAHGNFDMEFPCCKSKK